MSTLVEGPSTSFFAYETIRGRLLNMRRRKHSAPSSVDDDAGRSNKRRRDFASPEVIKRLKEGGGAADHQPVPAGVIKVEELDGKISAILWYPVSPTASESLNYLLGSLGRVTTSVTTALATATGTATVTEATVGGSESDNVAELAADNGSAEVAVESAVGQAAEVGSHEAGTGVAMAVATGAGETAVDGLEGIAGTAAVVTGAAVLVGGAVVGASLVGEEDSGVSHIPKQAGEGALEAEYSADDEAENVGSVRATAANRVPPLTTGSLISVGDEEILTPRSDAKGPYTGVFNASGSDVGSSQIDVEEETTLSLHDAAHPPPIPPKAARRSSATSTEIQSDEEEEDVKVIPTATEVAAVSVVEIRDNSDSSDSEMDVDEDKEDVKDSSKPAVTNGVSEVLPASGTELETEKVEEEPLVTISEDKDKDTLMADADEVAVPQPVEEEEKAEETKPSSVLDAATVGAAVAGAAIVSTVAISPEPTPRPGARLIAERPKSFYEREAEQWEKARVPFYVGSPGKSVVVTAEKLPVPPVPVSTTNPRAVAGSGYASKRSSGVWDNKRMSWASSIDDVFSNVYPDQLPPSSGNQYDDYRGVELRETDSLTPLPITTVNTTKGNRPKLVVSSNIPYRSQSHSAGPSSASSYNGSTTGGGLRRSISVITPPASSSRIKTPSSPKEEIAPLTWDARRETIMGPIGGPRPIGSTRLNGFITRSRSTSVTSVASRASTSPTSLSGFAAIKG